MKPRSGLQDVHLPDGSRSVQSPWVWRGFVFMSLIALGLCISFASNHLTVLAIAWAIIAVGWFTIAMWLWRKHLIQDNEAWAQREVNVSAPRSRRR